MAIESTPATVSVPFDWLNRFCNIASTCFRELGHEADIAIRPPQQKGCIVRYRCVRCGAVASATIQYVEGHCYPVLFMEGQRCHE